MLKTLALLTLLHAAPPSDSIAGTWQIRGDVMGNPLNPVCTIIQNGALLSGNCTLEADMPLELSGEVRDGRFTFRHGSEYQGEPLTIVYTGTLASPGELRGTVVVQPFAAGGSFTATTTEAQP